MPKKGIEIGQRLVNRLSPRLDQQNQELKKQVRFSIRESSESEAEEFPGQENFRKLSFEHYSQKNLPPFQEVCQPVEKSVKFPSVNLEHFKFGAENTNPTTKDFIEGYEPKHDHVKISFDTEQVTYHQGQVNDRKGHEPILSRLSLSPKQIAETYKVHHESPKQRQLEALDLKKLPSFQKLKGLFKPKVEYSIEVKPKFVEEEVNDDTIAAPAYADYEKEHHLKRVEVDQDPSNCVIQESFVSFDPQEVLVEKEATENVFEENFSNNENAVHITFESCQEQINEVTFPSKLESVSKYKVDNVNEVANVIDVEQEIKVVERKALDEICINETKFKSKSLQIEKENLDAKLFEPTNDYEDFEKQPLSLEKRHTVDKIYEPTYDELVHSPKSYQHPEVYHTHEVKEDIIETKYTLKQVNFQDLKAENYKIVSSPQEIYEPSCQIETFQANNFEKISCDKDTEKDTVHSRVSGIGTIPKKLRHSFSDLSGKSDPSSRKRKSFGLRKTSSKFFSSIKKPSLSKSSSQTSIKDDTNLPSYDQTLKITENITTSTTVNPFKDFDENSSRTPEVPRRVKYQQEVDRPQSEPIPGFPFVPVQSKSIVGYNRYVWVFEKGVL